MKNQSALNYWLAWIISTLLITVIFTYLLTEEGISKSMFMPGELSSGHHQLVDSCDSCHTSKFGGGEVLQQACIDCHGDQRVKPNDSHPRSKFKDPRNADTLAKINALECVSCHVEHRPEITLKDGLTQPKDVCFHCHAQVAEERPSHQGMSFKTCKDSGCHNFHNNRALYTDFLVKHMDDPDHKSNPHLPNKDFSDVLDEIMEYPREQYPLVSLTISDIDAPNDKSTNDQINQEWLKTSHANAGVNCTACHQTIDSEGNLSMWKDKPSEDSCYGCHSIEVDRFKLGKHGMRLQVGLSPMTPDKAVLPMKRDVAHKELTCNSCHGAHNYNVTYASVDACLECHADDHSLAYKSSKHFALWDHQKDTPNNNITGVTCAGCHMPRIDYDVNDWMSRTIVDHNQSANLSPNSKMIRSSCQHCHGLSFVINALADEKLIKNNFNGKSSIHVDSIDLARKDLERYLQEKQQTTH